MVTTVPGELRVVRYQLPSFLGDYRCMDYGDPYSDRLRELRERYRLEEVVAGRSDEMDALLALKRWVRSRWDHGWCRQFATVSDGLSILEEAEQGRQFCCGHYTRLLTDCATALGWPARPVSLSIADCEAPRDHHIDNVGHSVAEVWCTGLRKWVVLDADLNVHYRSDGVPQSAMELHDAWLSGQADRVEMIQDEPAFALPAGEAIENLNRTATQRDCYDELTLRSMFETFARHRALDYYARLSIAGLEWLDPRCPPSFIRHFAPYGGHRWTSNPADMYWSVNLVGMTLQPAWDDDAQATLAVSLCHCMPFFGHHQSAIDGGDWRRCEASFAWPLHPGTNRLACRAVNTMGRPGTIASIEVAYAPAPQYRS